MPFSEGEAVLIAEIDRDKIVRGKYALDAVSHRPTHLPSVPQISRTTNSSSNYADPRSVLPNWRPRTAPVSESAIVDGLESRQRTIGSPWSSDGSALESRLGSCPI